jgi:ribonucleoside-triphosphate reductase
LDQYGGVGIDRIDEALAPWAEKATTREVEQAMEALIFNLNSLHSRAGRLPHITVM